TVSRQDFVIRKKKLRRRKKSAAYFWHYCDWNGGDTRGKPKYDGAVGMQPYPCGLGSAQQKMPDFQTLYLLG
ncbi:MAG: hypothetical protein Q4D82_08615, partial [Neisseria sp.]|nr:hypothetical protein [Neisseria sp.]